MSCIIRLYTRRWMTREEFEEVASILKYLGRYNGRSVFEVDLNKIRKKGLELADILNYMKDYDLEFYDKSSEICFNNLVREENTVYAKLVREGVLLKSKKLLKPYLADFSGFVKYDRELGGYIVTPMKYFDVRDKLVSLGLEVVDETSIKDTLDLGVKIEFTGKLRDYQKEAIDKWIENGYRGIIALPTGSGKTIIGIAAICLLNERTLIVTYTREQLFQWIEKILEFTNADRSIIGTYYSDEKSVKPITVTTYQTAYRYLHLISHLYSFIIVDEVHHLPADKFKYIALNAFARKRMGLSATIYREDGRHEELFPLMGGIAYYKSPGELAEEGYLAPYVIRQIIVDFTPEEKRKYNELRKAYREAAKGRSFNQLLEDAKRGSITAQRALSIHSKMQQLVHMASRKLNAVADIVKKELARGSKIIIFTQYVEQAKKISEILKAPLLYGDLEPKERKRVLSEFKKAPTGVLVVTTVGDEGIDIPDANVGIVVAGTGSRRQFVQRLGRILRPHENKRAVLYEVIVKNTAEEQWAKRRKNLRL